MAIAWLMEDTTAVSHCLYVVEYLNCEKQTKTLFTLCRGEYAQDNILFWSPGARRECVHYL